MRTYEKIEKGEGSSCDVFDSTGKYIAKHPLNTQPLIWEKRKLYSTEKIEHKKK